MAALLQMIYERKQDKTMYDGELLYKRIDESAVKRAYNKVYAVLHELKLYEKEQQLPTDVCNNYLKDFSWERATQSIIECIYKIAAGYIEDIFYPLKVYHGINDKEDWFSLGMYGNEVLRMCNNGYKRKVITKAMKYNVFDCFEEFDPDYEKIGELIDSSDTFTDFINRVSKGCDVYSCSTVKALGRFDSDNYGKSDEEAQKNGEYLLKSYKSGKSKNLYFRFSDDSVILVQ